MISEMTVTVYRVKCETCGKQAPDANDKAQAQRNAIHTGWKSIGGKDVCPQCAQAIGVKPMK